MLHKYSIQGLSLVLKTSEDIENLRKVCLELVKQEEGKTLVPLKLYFVKNKAKILLGLCKGKKNYDKRESIKEKDIAREKEKLHKYSYR